jgi:DNA (cytosine-5)-methyltransferase 1
VVGVDHKPQPNYPFEVLKSDALMFLDNLIEARYTGDGNYTYGHFLEDFAAIHASPPCQSYSAMNRAVRSDAPKVITKLRSRLRRVGLPFVIENVEGADLEGHVVMLCGTMFGLRVRRHRLFEIEPPVLMLTPACQCKNGVVTGRLVGQVLSGKVAPGRTPRFGYKESQRREAIGVPWMTTMEARQAIPPAYTEFIGKHLLPSIQTPPKE